MGLLGLCLGSLVHAQDTDKPFYRGGLDDQVVVAPNGAKVNASYLDYWKASQTGGQVIDVRPGVRTLYGYHLVNVHVIEGEKSLIVIDTGSKVGNGQDFRKIIRGFSDKPIGAIIYTHHHYVGGALGLLDGQASSSVAIYGHPELASMLKTTHSQLGTMQRRRVARQFGAYLPEEGPDAALIPREKSYTSAKLNTSGYLPVTHPVADGEVLEFDGVKMRFHHIVGDTRDSLAIEFPTLDLIAHNSAMTSVAFPMYTLRGDFFRMPDDVIAGLDLLRTLGPTYLLNAHGRPYTSKQSGYEALTAHRDAYSFIWNQSLRAINQGKTPDQMAASIHLPEHLRNDPHLKPAYVDWEYGIRGIYRGMVGWYSEDGADLHPPQPEEIGNVIVEGFGGVETVIGRARVAFDAGQYNLAAKLMSWVIAAQPDNKQARDLKAQSLRRMAYATETGIQTRNFMLSEALHLEGKVDWFEPSPRAMIASPTVQSLMRSPPAELIKALESRVDPEAAAGLQTLIGFDFGDQGRCGLALRRGVAEFLAEPVADAQLTLALSHETLARVLLGEVGLSEAVKEGLVDASGNAALLDSVAAALELDPR